jgi:hypothetical protein
MTCPMKESNRDAVSGLMIGYARISTDPVGRLLFNVLATIHGVRVRTDQDA